MAFCEFSEEFVLDNKTAVDNEFIVRYLPYATDFCVKVYLFGLYKCQNPKAYDNDMQSFANELKVSLQDIEDAFLYWQDLGLVKVVNTIASNNLGLKYNGENQSHNIDTDKNAFHGLSGENTMGGNTIPVVEKNFYVKYIPLKNASKANKKFRLDKYNDFNASAQLVISGRMLTPNEYAEYYTFMEIFHFDPTALLYVMQYCVEIKGNNVGWSYILTVAKNWAKENLKTAKQIEERIQVLNQNKTDVGRILSICGAKRLSTVEEQNLFLKWKNEWKFDLEVLESVAQKTASKNSKPTFAYLDSKLEKYYQLKKMSIVEIDEYDAQKKELYQIAKQINKTLGIYYEDLSGVVDTYVSNWLAMGHTKKSLTMLGEYCFRNSIKSLEGLNVIVGKLFKLGIVSEESIKQYIDQIAQETALIRVILDKLGVARNVINQDRIFFNTWKYTWFVSDELIDYAIEKSAGKLQPFQYMNKLLATWHNQGITTIEDASKCVPKDAQAKSKKPNEKLPKTKTTDISEEDLNGLFDSLEEIKV